MSNSDWPFGEFSEEQIIIE